MLLTGEGGRLEECLVSPAPPAEGYGEAKVVVGQSYSCSCAELLMAYITAQPWLLGCPTGGRGWFVRNL